MYLMSEDRFIPKDEPLRKVNRNKILLWLLLQGLGVAATVAISQTIAAIGKDIRSIRTHTRQLD